MPILPHPIEVTVNDTDNATVKASVNVRIRNLTKGSQLTVEQTNASGIVVYDLANLEKVGSGNEYDTGDEILILAYYGPDSDASIYTVTGDSKSQTLNLNPVRFEPTTGHEVVKTLIVANTDGSTGYYAKFYTYNKGKLLAHVECPKGDTKIVAIPGGMGAEGGLMIVRENTAVIVTVVYK